MTQATAADRDRDGDSFAAFFAENRAAALAQALRLVRDRPAAEDVIAEAFARMWARWGRGTIDEPARYLARVVRNAAADHFRRAARERDRVVRAAGTVETQREPMTAAIEAREVVDALLDQLPPNQRRAVSLRYLLDLSEAQTAQSLGVSLGTVKSATSRSLHRLRQLHQLDTAA